MKRIAAISLATAAVVALGGCAVTGQAAGPNTAATYGQNVVTVDEVAAFTTALEHLGVEDPDAGAAVTLLLLEPTVTEYIAANAEVPSQALLEEHARAWMLYNGVETPEVSEDMIEAVRIVDGVFTMLNSQESVDAFLAAAIDISEQASVSPLYGDFDNEAFQTSLGAQVQLVSADLEALGELAYIPLTAVSGFDAALPSWQVTEAPAE